MARDDACRIAKEKIQEALHADAKELDLSWDGSGPKLREVPESLARLTRLQTLNLANNDLTALPAWLDRLPQLRYLDVSNNYLRELSDSIAFLTQLRNLDLSRNDLETLPDSISSLTRLRHLKLSNNALTILPESINRLTLLCQLDLSSNNLLALPQDIHQLTQLRQLLLPYNFVSVLPESIAHLRQLQVLNISGNPIHALPEWLGRLTDLRCLYASDTGLEELPESLTELTQLQRLLLGSNQLTALPKGLGQLTQLQILYLTRNNLANLPDALGDLAINGELKEIYLRDNPHLDLPQEVLGPDLGMAAPDNPPKPAKEILQYYFSTRGEAGQPLRELRLIVVGRPRVGKTTLIKRLRGLAMDPNESETHGIDITPLELECPYGPLHARVWDFGGQHVLHAMHEFFLRSRCLYLLVVEQRSTDVERDLTYWLQLIRSYAGDAPVVVALNQSKGIRRSLAQAALEREYDPIVAWVPTECASEEEVPGANASIEALREALSDAAAAMPEPKKLFPAKWLEIKKWLEGMKEPFLDYAEYCRHCAELHEEDPQQQAALAATMDELGVALNYARDPRLRDTTVLRPNWLANGIYALLRANILGPLPLAPDGVLTERHVGEILAAAESARVLDATEYPREKWSFLLRLMNLFQLSFPVDDKGERYLVPTLLPSDEPPGCDEPDGEDAVKLRYEFNVIPGPLLGRLLVRLFILIDGERRWQRGARLRWGWARAKVWADLRETYVYVTVSNIAGGVRDRGQLLEIIREALKEMFREYERLRVVEQWRHDNEWVPRRTLEKFGVLPPEMENAEGEGERQGAMP